MSFRDEPPKGSEGATPINRFSQEVEPLTMTDEFFEYTSRIRPDLYWGARGDVLVRAAARATCEDERRKLEDEAAKALALESKAIALMKRLGVSQMPDGVWSPEV